MPALSGTVINEAGVTINIEENQKSDKHMRHCGTIGMVKLFQKYDPGKDPSTIHEVHGCFNVDFSLSIQETIFRLLYARMAQR